MNLSTSSGSSPLARGTLDKCLINISWHRFIPAGAGNTRPCRRPAPTPAVHPRWRGEHSSLPFQAAPTSGSSPLARGTPRNLVFRPLDIRFIPAGAGNTRPAAAAARSIPVHPRWRGEHPTHSRRSASRRGSSPLARGTHLAQHPARRPMRFIPAGAGNTRRGCFLKAAKAVHPRWRGEHGHKKLSIPHPIGSSPLARGTHQKPREKVNQRRFIPAGAGNTSRLSTTSARTTVHPRWRGEHSGIYATASAGAGSSPLARGTLDTPMTHLTGQRFIPAGAGNTPEAKGERNRETVHPRWRGEHPNQAAAEIPSGGSSPLARGTPGQLIHADEQARFIPAGAGNTPG